MSSVNANTNDVFNYSLAAATENASNNLSGTVACNIQYRFGINKWKATELNSFVCVCVGMKG